MIHLQFQGEHYQMGVERGKSLKECQTAFPLQLDDFQRKHGEQSEEILSKYFPEVCWEIRGVSDTLGLDYLRFTSWMLCRGCCMCT